VSIAAARQLGILPIAVNSANPFQTNNVAPADPGADEEYEITDDDE